MYKKLDIESWSRKSQFYFFKKYDNPFFNICTEIDVTPLHEFVKANNHSFFLASLFVSLKAANEIEEFKYRIKGNDVIIYDEIHAGSTVANDDNTFSFCYFDYQPTLKAFESLAKKELCAIKTKTEKLDTNDDEDNMIHYSVLPWYSFFSISHPRKFNTEDSVPKIVFGKFSLKNNKLMMPISIEVHHSLMDGFHIGQYLSHLQEIINESKNYLGTA